MSTHNLFLYKKKHGVDTHKKHLTAFNKNPQNTCSWRNDIPLSWSYVCSLKIFNILKIQPYKIIWLAFERFLLNLN